MSSFSLPLPSRPNIPYSRAGSPSLQTDSDDAVITGVELIIAELDHSSVQSAHTQFSQLVSDFNNTNPTQHLPPFQVHPGDPRNSVDYVFISLHPDLTPELRPDILEQVRKVFDGRSGLRAGWRTGSGTDQSRRVMFIMDSEQHARTMQPRLEKWMNDHGMTFQGCFLSKPSAGSFRITFDILDPTHVAQLRQQPPMFDRRTYPVVQSQFIPPIYSLQVAVAGCGEFQGIEGRLNTYIHRRYGNDAIAYSRMVLEGEVYTVVLKDWATTSRLVSDPFKFFSDTSIPHFISISQPILLYLLNSADVPLNPAFLSHSSPSTSPDQRSIQAQIDALCQQGLETVHTFSDVVKQQHAMIMELRSQGNHVMSAVSMVASSVSTSAQLSSVENQLGRLHDRRAQLEDKLILAPEPNAHQYIQSRIHSIDEETHELNDRAAHLRRGLQALASHIDTTLRLLPTPAAEHSTAQSLSQSSSGHLRPEIDSDEQQRYQPRPRMTPSPPGPQPDGMQTEMGSEAGKVRKCIVDPFFTLAPTYAINANGLANVSKMAAIANAITLRQPHAWIINETKLPQPQASRIRVNGYNTFEEPGLPLSTGRSRKWGVILGIKRSIHTQHIPTPPQLHGRAVILDAIILTEDGHGFPH
ncbi:hypothetical protein SCP_0300200 [Sparassis crispa]|uniref:Uncharacterized protein n=1 Tax=Sparassis crispa TaxID=139825 RepID=A0A401GDV5_9APHY|nr:hypothetical protein SCP_0300200 [Sparassis crispa]GBE80305.1 hypothetical protein SCP_0300200 [Sparassis crispa]